MICHMIVTVSAGGMGQSVVIGGCVILWMFRYNLVGRGIIVFITVAVSTV